MMPPPDGAAPRPPARQPALRFGAFVLDAAQARLTRDGQPLALRPKALELLAVLADRPGELVTKDELLDAVWGRRFITEGVVKSTVAELRVVLGDDPKAPQWIETVPRRGYRFAGHVEADAPLPAAAPPGAPVRGNAPNAFATLVGREADLAALASLLAASRLLTLAGPSGIGKTSLALAFAASVRGAWPDGVWCVELAPLAAETTTVAGLFAVFAQALRLDAAIAGEAALGRALQPLQLLIVVDNAEHVLAPLAAVLAPLLVQAPLLRVIVTSQEPLRMAGEQVYRLAPLALPPSAADGDPERLLASAAVQLFVERVAARQPGFRLAPQQQAAVAAICRALDGLPLALELAAARVQLLGVQGIAKMLLGDEEEGAGDAGTRLRLLTQGARDAVPRQRTLRDALAWSHDLLDAPQRRVFRRLGVFRGGFTLALAQAVVGEADLDLGMGLDLDDWAVMEAVQALVEKSLLVAVPHLDPAVPLRFMMLESLRSFALERLAEAGETAAVRWRHLQAVLGHWRRADARSVSDPALTWLALHRPEVDNLRAALRWALADDAALARAAAVATPAPGSPMVADAALALVVAAGSVWHRAGLANEGREACERVRARAAVTGDGGLRGGFDLTLAALGCYANAYPPAEALAAAQAAALAFEAGGDRVRAYFATYLAYQMNIRVRSLEGRAASLARLEALDEPGWGEMLARYLRHARAYEDRLSGRAEAYLAICRDERARCARLGAVAEGWSAAHGLMLAEHDQGDVAAALLTGREVLAEIRAAGRLGQHGALLALWATMLAQSGAPAEARVALAEALPALRSAGTPWMLQVALAWLAASEAREEDAARLAGWHEAGRRERRVGEAGSTIAGALHALHALLHERLGAAASKRLQAEGAGLDDGAAERLAFGTEPSPAFTKAGPRKA